MIKQEIYFIIKDTEVDYADQHISLSKVETKRKITYKDMLETALKNIFNNSFSLSKNILKLEEILSTKKWSYNHARLKKYGISFKKLQEEINNKPLENFNINIFFEERIDNRFNVLSLFSDIKNSNEGFELELKRIEFLDNNLDSYLDFSDCNNFDFKFVTINKKTPKLNLMSLVKETKELNFYNDDDYRNDKLLIQEWRDYLNLFYEANKDDATFQKNNQIYLNDLEKENDYILCSKVENKNWRNVSLVKIYENSGDYEDTEYKFKDLEIKESFNQKQFLEILKKHKQSNIDRLSEIKDLILELEKNLNVEKQSLKNLKFEINTLDEKKSNNETKYNLWVKEKIQINDEINRINDDIKKILNKGKKEKDLDTLKDKELIRSKNKYLDELKSKLELKEKEINILFLEYKNEYQNENNLDKWISVKISELKNELKTKEQHKNTLVSSISRIENELKEKEIIRKECISFDDSLEKFKNSINKYKYFYKISYEQFNTNNKIIELLDARGIINKSNGIIYGLEQDNVATAVKIKRLRESIRNLIDGNVKNYNLYNAVKNPSAVVYENDLDQNIVEHYNLNEKQKEAVEKTLNINDIMYLQGPPGTGKTQTLSAIAESFISNNKNILMCSSTHEAIDNFFERLHEHNIDKPYVIIYKYKFISDNKKTEKQQQFDREKIFSNFKNSIYSYHIKDHNKNKIDVLELLNDYIKKYGYDLPKAIFSDRKSRMPKSYYNLLVKDIDLLNRDRYLILINDNENDNDNDNVNYIWPFDDVYDPILTKEMVTTRVIKHKIEEYYNKGLSNDIKEQFELLDKIIENAEINDLSLLFDRDLISKLKNKKSKNISLSSLENKLKILRDKRLDDIQEENNFLNYIFDNNLINVIGCTTTSRQNIEMNGKVKHLFNDYNIDLLMIDEVSKSSTPEIIAKSILAKKTILCGDYRQLPPAIDFATDKDILKVIEYVKTNTTNKINENNYYVKDILLSKLNQGLENEKIISDFQKEAEKLFKTSFFVNQVQKIKNSNKKNSCYTFLNECHRFGERIARVVNINYDNDEKLISKKEPSEIIKFNLTINDQLLDDQFVVLDILNNEEYFTINHKFKSTSFFPTFDQSGKPFELKGYSDLKIKADSLYNQYTAQIIADITRKLILENEKEFKNNNRIAIITLTKAQKEVVWYYIKNLSNIPNEYKRCIKVDTIDNFQGREEEIVIVDFIRGETKIRDSKVEKSNKRVLSFLDEKERINVAVSRPKSKLILIGYFSEYLTQKSLDFQNKSFFKECLSIAKELDSSYLYLDKKIQ